jgi:hypothetical protein
MKPKTKKSFNLDTDVKEMLALWKLQNIGVIESRLFNNALRVALAPFKRRSKVSA